MIKKVAVLVCSIFIFSSLAVAGEGVDKKTVKEKNVKAISMKKESEEYYKELDALIQKYNTANKQEQNSVKNEIKVLILNYTEKDVFNKKSRIVKEKEKIERMEKEIINIEIDIENHVNTNIDFYLSTEGQNKLEEINKKEKKKLEKKREQKKAKK